MKHNWSILRFRWITPLVAVVIIGWAAQSTWQLRPIEVEYRRLLSKVGRFVVEDPTQVTVAPMKSDRSNDRAWHFYIPAGCELECEVFVLGQVARGIFQTAQATSIYRTEKLDVRFSFYDAPVLSCGFGRAHTRSPNMADFLRRHFAELNFSASIQTLHSFDPKSQVLTVFEARIPESLLAEAQAENKELRFGAGQPLVVRVRIGTFRAFRLSDGK